MKIKYLSLGLGILASLATAAMLQSTPPVPAQAAYRVVKTKKYNNQYYFQKTWGKSASMWNRSHTQTVGNLNNYPTVTYNLKSSAVLQNGRKRAVYYHIGGFVGNGYKYGWVWRGYLKRGAFESAASLYEKNGAKAPTSYGRLTRRYDLSSSATNLESYKRFAKLPSKAQIKTVVNFINNTVVGYKEAYFAKNNYRIISRPLVLPKTVNKDSKATRVGYRIPIVVDNNNNLIGTFRAFYDAATSTPETSSRQTLVGGIAYTLPAYSFMRRDSGATHVFPIKGSSLAVVSDNNSFFYAKKNAISSISSDLKKVFSGQPANPKTGDTYRSFNSNNSFIVSKYDGKQWNRDYGVQFTDLKTDWDDDEGSSYGQYHSGQYSMTVVNYRPTNSSKSATSYETTKIPFALTFPSKSFDQNMIKNMTAPDSTFTSYLKLAK
ncbi:hypothetical protein [Secundilactobacillus kimchicus]|uniref:hypothetical protein n=1 Tax=Secundilactobacillus kimchicus TaxID=528209 RepID=UPI0024A81E80|nr:hypothetical protein [Secundilactobacillus kimchicus]